MDENFENLINFELYEDINLDDFNFENNTNTENEVLTTVDATAVMISQPEYEQEPTTSSTPDEMSSVLADMTNYQQTETQNYPSVRFPEMTESDIKDLTDAAIKVNTVRSTKTWLNVWGNWCTARSVNPEIEKYNPVDLDKLLVKFYAEVKKQNGEDYEPECLRVMQAGLDRHLRENGYEHSIITDRLFSSSIKTLDAKATYLRQQGKGKRKNRAQPLTTVEEESLWTNGLLGDHSGKALTNVNFKNLSEHMGMRGRQEHYDAYVDDFEICHHEDGSESVKFAENTTKTRGGGLRVKRRKSDQEMWSTDGGPRDPVYLFKLWLSKRPSQLRDNGALYLSIIPRPKKVDEWYTKVRMGINTISKLMPTMAVSLQTNKKLSNHSTRKTVVQKLKKSGQPRHKIKEVTGHACESSLDDYDSLDEDEKKQLSHIISGYKDTDTVVETRPENSAVVPPHAQVAQAALPTSYPQINPQNFTMAVQSNQFLPPMFPQQNAFLQMPPAFFAPGQGFSTAPVVNYNNCQFYSNSKEKKRVRRPVIFDSDSD